MLFCFQISINEIVSRIDSIEQAEKMGPTRPKKPTPNQPDLWRISIHK